MLRSFLSFGWGMLAGASVVFVILLIFVLYAFPPAASFEQACAITQAR